MSNVLSPKSRWIAATLAATLAALLALGVILPNIYSPLMTAGTPGLGNDVRASVTLAKLAYVAWAASAIGLLMFGHGRHALVSRLGWTLLALLVVSALLKSCGPLPAGESWTGLEYPSSDGLAGKHGMVPGSTDGSHGSISADE